MVGNLGNRTNLKGTAMHERIRFIVKKMDYAVVGTTLSTNLKCSESYEMVDPLTPKI